VERSKEESTEAESPQATRLGSSQQLHSSTAPLAGEKVIGAITWSNPLSRWDRPKPEEAPERDLQGLRTRWAAGRGAPEVSLCFGAQRTMPSSTVGKVGSYFVPNLGHEVERQRATGRNVGIPLSYLMKVVEVFVPSKLFTVDGSLSLELALFQPQ